MKNFLSVMVLLLSYTSFSQHFLPLVQDTSGENKGVIAFSSNGDYASNAMGKDIVKSFFYGGYIDQEMKNNSIQRLQNINQFGLDMNAELVYRSKSNVSKNENKPFYSTGMIFQAGFHSFSSVLFSKDAFRYVFEGNSLFLGDTADFSGTRFQSLAYSKIGFGLFNRNTHNSIVLNVLSLNNYSNGGISTGTIAQNVPNDSISLTYDGGFSFANQSGFSKGLGLSFDVDYRFKTMENDRAMTFQFLAKNIGFIVPSGNVTTYQADSNFTYTGFHLDQLTQQNLLHTDRLMDTLGIEKTSRKTTLLVPGFIQFSKLVDMNSSKRIQSFYGARMFLSKNYIPFFFVGAHGRVTKKWSTGISASYGGFSQLKWGMYSSFQINRWNVGVASENLLSKTGESIIIQVKCAF
ncbi:MAG: hypothetical protein RJB36_512 [Bacteroidota bacterium]